MKVKERTRLSLTFPSDSADGAIGTARLSDKGENVTEQGWKENSLFILTGLICVFVVVVVVVVVFKLKLESS